MMTLSQRDCDRLFVLHQVMDDLVTVTSAARRLGISRRQVHRLLLRLAEDGDIGVVHRGRGRRSNHRAPDEVRSLAMERAMAPVYHDFGPTLLAEHLARGGELPSIPSTTLRRWMIEEGLWSPTPRKLRHRQRRERKAAAGELIQMDTSVHPWLENRSSEPIVLVSTLDDATSRLFGRFVPRDTGAANRQLLVDYLSCYGRMQALYTDRASHFEIHCGESLRKVRDQEIRETIIRRALAALGIELILAYSPQAKGRIERSYGTLQDRLVKELRVEGIVTCAAADRFLQERFVPEWNSRFTVAPRERADAHRPLPEGTELLSLFAETERRLIRNDFTFLYRGQWLQIPKQQARSAMPGSYVTIERRLDATTCYRWQECWLSPLPRAVAQPQPKDMTSKPTTGHKRKPRPDHPWRNDRRFVSSFNE